MPRVLRRPDSFLEDSPRKKNASLSALMSIVFKGMIKLMKFFSVLLEEMSKMLLTCFF